jgi:hypothetical protein
MRVMLWYLCRLKILILIRFIKILVTFIRLNKFILKVDLIHRNEGTTW